MNSHNIWIRGEIRNIRVKKNISSQHLTHFYCPENDNSFKFVFLVYLFFFIFFFFFFIYLFILFFVCFQNRF